MNNITNVSYLRTSRQFPNDLDQLSIQMTRGYIDIANAVNVRTIGIFTTNLPSVTGESWYLTNNQKQQSLRKAFVVSSVASYPHGITVVTPSQFVRCWGSYTDGTDSFGMIWASDQAIDFQVTFYVTSTDIVILSGVGAPTLTSGTVILEYLSNV